MKPALIVLALFFIHCGNPSNIRDVELPAADGRTIAMDSVLDAHQHTSFLFFSPECPVCIQSVPELLQMDSIHRSMVFVYPGSYFDAQQLLKFHQEYRIKAPAVIDSTNQLVELLDAVVMPQAIVTDSEGVVLYSGAIDDRSPALGERRQVVTQRYLGAVLDSLALGRKIPFASTSVHGCYIERKED
jgi:hypothetical protein